MFLQSPQQKLATQMPFREIFKSYVGSEVLPTLNTVSANIARQMVLTSRAGKNDVCEALPDNVRNHCKKLKQEAQFPGRLELMVKSQTNGMIIGLATNGVCYVVAVWDKDGYDLWQPNFVICLSCRQEVEVKMLPYGDGHIATCPKCNRLAYSGD